MPALERCVGDVESFFDRYWGRAPLLHSDRDAPSFGDLASLDDLDHMVASLGLSTSRLRMVKDGSTLPPAVYSIAAGAKSRATELQVSPALVFEHFEAGATIVLESLHKYWAPLTDFCRDLELALGHPLQVNAYITPPGSQGFAVHRDDHDVFVLQVHGKKHWLVYDREPEDTRIIDGVVGPGDALYIPKGFPHAATTDETPSAHLTVGILTHEAIEVVRVLAGLAEEEPLFEERLSAELVRDPEKLRASVEHYVDELRVWLDKVDLDELGRRLVRRVRTTSQPILRGQLRQLGLIETIADSTTLTRRHGATCDLFRDGDVLRILLSDRELEMPPFAEPAMREVVRRDRLQARDLHALLDPGAALVLVRRLVREGLLEVVLDG